MSFSLIFSLAVFFLSIATTLVLAVVYPAIRIGRNPERGYDLDTFFIGPLIGAILVIATGTIDGMEALKGLWSFCGLNPLGIVILFFSMVLISQFLETTGFFTYCAMVCVRKSGKSGRKLFFLIYAMVSVPTIFTSNDVVVLTFTPFIRQFAVLTGIDPLPFLYGEFFAANTWSMIFIISNPTNVVLGTAFGLTFSGFAAKMALAACLVGLVNCGLIYAIFREKINQEFRLGNEEEDLEESTAAPDEKRISENWRDRSVAIGTILVTILVMALSSLSRFPFEIWHISALFGAVVLVYMIIVDCTAFRRRGSQTFLVLSRLPIAILPFLLALFVLVNVLMCNGVFTTIGSFLGKIVKDNPGLNVLLYGVLSTLSVNVLNAIPMSVAFVPIIQAAADSYVPGALYAAIAGSNLGANVTPFGALGGLMWMRMLKRSEVNLKFTDFVKVGLKVTPLTLAVALGSIIVLLL
jgi:arsenical pump membrane protein